MTLEGYLRQRRLYEFLFTFTMTTLFGLVNATSLIIERIRVGEPSRWESALATELTATWTIMLLIPPLVWFLRRLDLRWSNFKRRALWHIPAYLCFSLSHVALFVIVRKVLWASVNESYQFGPLLLGLLYEMRKGLLIYAGLVLLILGYRFILDRLHGEADYVGTGEEGNLDGDPSYTRQFLIRMLNKQYLVKAGSIDWVQSADNYVILHCGTRSYPMRQTLSGLAGQLDPQTFARVHRTAIVNISKVIALQETGGAQLELDDGTTVPLSKTYLPGLKQLLQNRQGVPALVRH